MITVSICVYWSRFGAIIHMYTQYTIVLNCICVARSYTHETAGVQSSGFTSEHASTCLGLWPAEHWCRKTVHQTNGSPLCECFMPLLILLERCWRHCVFGFVMHPCICVCVHPWLKMWTCYFIKHLREFHQIYNFGAFSDKDKLTRFLRQKVKVMIDQLWSKIYVWTILLP